MVTAGVFMVARLSPLFELAPNAQAVVTLVGATTASFAARSAWCRTTSAHRGVFDLLAAWLHVVAMGVGAVFGRHVPPVHACVLSRTLVLGSGSVITRCITEQDIRRMGACATSCR